jgi:hypothetical protein
MVNQFWWQAFGWGDNEGQQNSPARRLIGYARFSTDDQGTVA